MTSPFVGEFMGTAILMLLGNGAVATVLLHKSKGYGGGPIIVSSGWCFAVVTALFTAKACGSPNPQINPIVSFALAILTHNFSSLLPFVAAQMLGAFVGGVLVWLLFLPHWAETPDQIHKLDVFCTMPAMPHKAANFISELITSFLMVFCVICIFSPAGIKPPEGLSPFMVGALVWALIGTLGGHTGPSLNPARDLGCRVAHQVLPIAGKGSSGWDYAPIPFFATMLGSTLAAFLLKALGI